MKKLLPFIFLGVGVVVLLIVFFFVNKLKSSGESVEDEEETALIDVALEDRPYVSLRPSSDGHYLLLKIENIVIPASTLDYELLYQTKDNITQGVPGTVALEKGKDFEADLLLGSESSGKFRYDEGVNTGSVTLRFRNDQGKLVARFTTDFHMQTGVSEVESVDKTFKSKVDGSKTGVYFVTMQTIGEKTSLKPIASENGYAVFSSELR